MLSALFGVEIKMKSPRQLSFHFSKTGLMAFYCAKAKLANLYFPVA